MAINATRQSPEAIGQLQMAISATVWGTTENLTTTVIKHRSMHLHGLCIITLTICGGGFNHRNPLDPLRVHRDP